MKRCLYFLLKSQFVFLMVFFISCEKEESSLANEDGYPIVVDLGFLGKYLKKNYDISVIKTTESYYNYDSTMATSRGYVFETLNKLKITEVGGLIAEKGVYRFEIYGLKKNMSNEIFFWQDSIEITKTDSFQYKKLKEEIILNKFEKYVIQYFSKDHNSIYDAGACYISTDLKDCIEFPLKIDDVKILSASYEYYWNSNGEYMLDGVGRWQGGILRGLVDFKYEILE